MKKIFNISSITFVVLAAISSNTMAQIDTDATTKTKAVFENLRNMGKSDEFLFGQEFFNSYRQGVSAASDDELSSDCKDVTGQHPAVLGSDFHYYLYKTADEKRRHVEAVKYAYQQGYVITMDWHMYGKYENSYNYNANNNNRYLVYNIANNLYDERTWFYGELDKIISIINSDLVVNGENIPVVLRLFHEMNGNWFWWGSAAASAANYKTFYQVAVDYIKARTTSVLFAWSPDTSADFSYYPGDGYVDVLGLDFYEVGDAGNKSISNFRTQMGYITDYTEGHGKVAVVAETGYRTGDANWASGNYWTDNLLPAIKDDPAGKTQRVAYVLSWMNSSWANPYVSYSGSSSTSKQKLIDFKNTSNVIFGGEMPYSMYETFFIPTQQTISLKGNNTKFVSSMNGASAMMCTATTAQSWEYFYIEDKGNHTVALKGNNGKYVTSNNGASAITCNTTLAQAWEIFTWIKVGNNKVVLRGNNGKYISSENGTTGMTCSRSPYNTWETFDWTLISGLRVAVADETKNIATTSLNSYPNPAGETLNIDLTGFSKETQLIIYDASGKSRYQKNVNESQVVIPTYDHLTSGFYIIKASDEKKTLTKKIMVK